MLSHNRSRTQPQSIPENSMSYPDHPPQLPFMAQPYQSGNVGGFWPQGPMDSKHLNSQSQFEHGPPFKRPRNYDNGPQNSGPFPPPMNPRTTHQNPPVIRGIFFKTRMCMKFLDGNCQNGANCSFAHGIEDMRDPPPNWKQIVGAKDTEPANWNDDQRIIYRMRICRKFYNGEECQYGERCNFLHESPSKFRTENIPRPLRESSGITIGSMGPVVEHRSDTHQSAEINNHINASSHDFGGNMTKPAYWKTKMCSKWEITGQCPFGGRCHFAHGQSELQVPTGHIESEVVTNINSIPPMADLPTETEVVCVPTQSIENNSKKSRLSEWRLHKKITTIYGDWPEDLIAPEKLAS